jgi:hypothetical protein
MEPVFILISASDCGACTSFKLVWPSIKPKIEALGVTVVEINIPRKEEPLDDSWPNDLKRYQYRTWVPMMLLVDGGNWEAAKRNKAVRINAKILNGVFEDGASKPSIRHGVRLNEREIVEWVKNNKDSLPKGSAPVIVNNNNYQPLPAQTNNSTTKSVCKMKYVSKRIV